MNEDWLGRWAEGRTGWHEAAGNEGLKAHWPDTATTGSVLVPLCGKTPDLLWLARRGHDVVGIELSEIAVAGFFEEHALKFDVDSTGPLIRYAAADFSLTIFCGDYFEFAAGNFDALYDRGALVTQNAVKRPRYVEHTKRLLKPSALRLIITLEYDQVVVSGPPFSVPAGELTSYWDDLKRVAEKDDIDTCPPKFRKAGLTDIKEVLWLSE